MEITNMYNENGIKSATFTENKKSFNISYWSRSKTINVCAMNAMAKVHRMANGKSFTDKITALNGYKSIEAKNAIEKAAALFQFN